jgi:hypothetical protein
MPRSSPANPPWRGWMGMIAAAGGPEAAREALGLDPDTRALLVFGTEGAPTPMLYKLVGAGDPRLSKAQTPMKRSSEIRHRYQAG